MTMSPRNARRIGMPVKSHGSCPHCGADLVKLPAGLDAYRLSCPNGFKSAMCDQVDGVIVPQDPSVEMLEALFGGMHCAGEPVETKISPAKARYRAMLAASPFNPSN